MTSRAEARRPAAGQGAAKAAVVWDRSVMPASATSVDAPAAPATAPAQSTAGDDATAHVVETTADAAAALEIAPQTAAQIAPETDTSSTAAEQPMTRRRHRQRTQSAAVVDSLPASTVAPTTIAEPTLSVSEPAQSPSEPAAVSMPLPVITAAVPTAAQAAHADAFEAAARLFSFTGETPIQSDPAVETEAGETEPAEETAPATDASQPAQPSTSKKHKAPRRKSSGVSLKRIAAASASFGAIVAVGLLTVGATMPAEAVAAPASTLYGATTPQQAGDVVGTADNDEIQAYVAPVDAAAPATDLDRSANFTTATLVEMAGTTGISNVSNRYFTNNPQCDVQWPFAVGVPISFGYGPRPGEFHTGVDFTPGNGAHVQAIADGTVRVAQEGYQGYGVAVIIDHVIDGQHWATLYGHMQYGSLQVHAGEKVKVGQYLGRTGNTGFSFGAHTHVEVLQNGSTTIDPMPWLRAHNKC